MYVSRRRWYRRPTFWLSLVFLLAVAGVGAFILLEYALLRIPLPDELDTRPTIVLDSSGKKIGALHEQAAREDVALADIPEHVRHAVLAAEDADFYEHPGVNLLGIVRAAVSNVRSGEIRQGGSTISQQYVKTVTGEDEQSVLRKVREAVLAMKLEREVPKDQILEHYLNTIYFGRGAYGIQAAARAYFRKDVSELSRAESAMLTGLIPAPSASDPIDHPQRAVARYAYVVGRVREEGWIDGWQAGRLRRNMPQVAKRRTAVQRTAPFFLSMVERELADRFGERQIYNGLTVRTTLDLRMQKVAEQAYRSQFDALAAELGPDVELPAGALVSLDVDTGGIRALVGGRNYAADQYNLATGGPHRRGRQPGSAFKPFGLSAWIHAGNSPESRFDAPAEIAFSSAESGGPNGWSPRNYGGQAYGNLTLREATWSSVNTVYAQVAVELGADRIVESARAAGIDSELDATPAIVLGSEEVTPLELAEAYNTFASGGTHREPTTIVSVERDGRQLYKQPVDEQRAFDKDVAWTTVDVLRGVIEQGTATAAQIGRPAAGKTGTTDESSDAWFAGFTPQLTTVVWIGNRDGNDPIPGSPTGGGLPAMLWAAYMTEALEGIPAEDFPEPVAELDTVGEPTTPACPEGSSPAPDGSGTCVPAEPLPESVTSYAER